MRTLKKTHGFTLIELMIVVAVVGILAAIAYPSYKDYVLKSRRVDAKAALTEAAQRLEIFYARNGQYTTDMTDLGYAVAGWNNVPIQAANQFYQIRLESVAGCAVANCYVLRAQRLATSDQINDDVEFYELWSDGRKRSQLVGESFTDSWEQ